MKNLKFIFLLCPMILLGYLGQAQVVDKSARLDIGIGLNTTKGHLRMVLAPGFWITPNLTTQLFLLSPQRRTLLFEPSTLRLVGGRMEKASIKLGETAGFNFSIYQKPKRGFFGGIGLTRQKYLVTAKSVFDNDFQPSFGAPLISFLLELATGDTVIKEETSANVWGFNWQLGYAFPTKNGRFEVLVRQNKFLIKNRKYAYRTSKNSADFDYRSVKSDFALLPLSFEMSYVIDLF